MALNNEYKILNDVLGVMNIHSIWICISELKTEIFISDISMRGVNLELVLSKLYKDGHIEEEIRSSRYTRKTEKHYRISFDGNIFLKRGGYLLGNLSQTIQQQPSKEEQVKDADGVQPIKDITSLKPLMNTNNENEFIKIINSIYSLVVYDHSKKTADKKKVMYVIHLLIKNGWLLDVSNNKQHYVKTVLEYFGYNAIKRDFEDFHFHDTETIVSSDNNKKYTLIFREVMENKNKLH